QTAPPRAVFVHNPTVGAARAGGVSLSRPSFGRRWARSVQPPAKPARSLWLLTLLVMALADAFVMPAPSRAQGAASQIWVYTLPQGDTLLSICRAYLRAPEAWRTVGQTNGVLDPTRLRVGAKLRIPLTMLRTFVGGADAMWMRGEVRAFSSDGGAVTVTP